MAKICKDCGQAFPATAEHFYVQRSGVINPYCKACHKARNLRWRQQHPKEARVIAARALANPTNRAAALERHRRDRAARPEAHRLKVRLSYYRHQQERLEARRAYGVAHRAKESAARDVWRKRNPLRDKMTVARMRARKHGCEIFPVVPERVMARDGMTCHVCGLRVSMAQLIFDHLKPLSKRGAHSEDNLAIAHYSCNRGRGDAVKPPLVHLRSRKHD